MKDDAMNKRLGLAAELLRHGEFESVIVVLQELGDVDDGRCWRLRGLAHFALGKMDAAIDALEHASILLPLCAESQCRLAKCYQNTGRKDVASAIYAHLATFKALPEQLAEVVGLGLFDLGEYARALEFCRANQARFIEHPQLLAVTFRSMHKLRFDHQAILPLVLRAHRLEPDNVSYCITLARLLVTAGRHAEAVQVLRGVDLNALQCIASLEQMRMLFEQLRQVDAAHHCRERLQQIGYELSSAYRPPKI